MESPRILAVSPTYNEAENITTLLSNVLHGHEDRHILIVDDGSPDGTADLAETWGAEHAPGRVHVLRRSGKLGLGTAYLAGFTWALERGYDVIIQMDADGSHPAAVIPQLVEAAQRTGLAIGSRYVPGGGTVDWPLTRRLISRAGNLYANTILRTGVHDVTGGYKAWTAEVLRAIGLDTITATGYVFQVEMTAAAIAAGARPAEVPIIFRDRVAGQSKMTADIAREGATAVWQVRRRYRKQATK